MKTFKKLLLVFVIAAVVITGGYFIIKEFLSFLEKQGSNSVAQKTSLQKTSLQKPSEIKTEEQKDQNLPLSEVKPETKPEFVFVGPRQNIPENAPTAYGFWSFAYPIPGVLSRSGQPTIKEFQWLKENGWKSIVDLREEIDRNENGDDRKILGFNKLGFNYLYLPTPDGSAPSNEDAQKFLDFVENPANQPIHVHCRGGIGRAGTMVILARVKLQNWPLQKAIEESRLFQGGVSENQLRFLKKYLNE